ncbi:MAG: HD domain-containing protein [Desulforhopalus sp.]|nr:HD domain-containing protein [Desulforhopalus sp.]
MQCVVPDNLPKLWQETSPEVADALLRLVEKSAAPLYLVGGTVRDWLLGKRSGDIDVATPCSALALAKMFRDELGGGAIVDLSGPDDEAVRVVWRGEQVDFATFREKTATIEEDLRRRDFTINAMAVPLSALAGGGQPPQVLDPTGGLSDLRDGLIQSCPGAFFADPVRMLRGYRLRAVLGFSLAPATRTEVRQQAFRITGVAAERSSYELRLIFSSPRTSEVVRGMAEDGLLAVLLPELYLGAGVVQPEFHHLDVLGHSFLTLAMMEEILADPRRFYPGRLAEITEYLQEDDCRPCLKWAALLHDVGKPVTGIRQPGDGGRLTFYRHDEEGNRIFRDFAMRNRWSNADAERTGRLIAMHMHPFHLCNVAREVPLTRRAALKLCQRAGAELPGLFLLAMADSLASKGEKKPERMEAELAELYDTVHKVYKDYIQPVLLAPRLLTGKDLIEEFALVPGPLFATLLDELDVARVEGTVFDRPAALAFVAAYLQGRGQARSSS